MTNTRPITEIAAETKRLAEAATPGPWTNEMGPAEWPNVYYPNNYVAFQAGSKYTTLSDSRFIAASRTNAPLLADAVIECVEALQYCAQGAPYSGKVARALLTKLGATTTTEGG